MFMTKRLLLAATMASVLLPGCAASPEPSTDEFPTYSKLERGDSVVIHSTFGRSDIKNWQAPNNSTLIIETYSHGDFIAKFMSPCVGIRTTETIGFDTMGPFDLDSSTKVLLPDGRWCHFGSLRPYEKPPRDTGDRD
jgi:hypothetical protein